jgi:2',3'-cyclic-nucleotide 2'-phosphodiesterase (5'-nucleotidase family)
MAGPGPVHAGNSAAAVGKAAGPENPKWPSCDGHCVSQKLSFVHIADLHAHYNPDKDGSNPVARIRGVYEQIKKENPFTIFTNAGDDYEKGSLAEERSRGRTTREIVHALKFDVRTLGNHDFAWGIEELFRFSHDPSAAVPASNIRMTPEKDGFSGTAPGWTDFSILTVGCVRIGFFGLVTRPWGEADRPYDGPYFREYPALQADFNFSEIAGGIIARYRQEVDLLVLVSHLGLQDDILLAQQINGIDLILGGHTHSTTSTPLNVNNTLIVHSGAFGETIGRMDIEYDVLNKRIADTRFRLIANRPGEAPEDEYTRGVVAEILKPYQQDLYEPVTHIRQDREKDTVALIGARAAMETLDIDAAFVHKGTVWQDWRQGELTRQDILDAFKVERQPAGTPGCSSLYRMEMKGEDLIHARAVLKNCVYQGPDGINPNALYTVALQKPQAFNQLEIFGKIIGSSEPKPVKELWETVVAFAQNLKSAGLSLDQGLNPGSPLVALVKANLLTLTSSEPSSER